MTILLDLFKGSKRLNRTPIWLMRQAGRYLPEYNKLRKKVGSFLSLCYNPAYCCEATLQPIERFNLDAAIIFSDILVIPHALGQDFDVIDNIGPVLRPVVRSLSDLEKLRFDGITEKLAKVYSAISMVRSKLDEQKSLIGFCGAPFTISFYMMAGGADSRGFSAYKPIMHNREFFDRLIDLLVDSCILHLKNQIIHGADVVQIFESCGDFLSSDEIMRYSVLPISRICAGVKEEFPDIPIIIFPRGANKYYSDYVSRCKFDCFSADYNFDISILSKNLPFDIVLQGNLSPDTLLRGGEGLVSGVRNIMESCVGRRLIFNLGHGIRKETSPLRVEELISLISRWDSLHN